MSSRIGSDQNFIATTSAGILDDQANSIVSSDTTFGSSPLGIAARTQALYGIANANFNLTPPDPEIPIVDNDNPLPYWTLEDGTEGDGSAIAVFDETTSTWGVELSLGTTTTDAAITMTTRSFLLTDDNLALRQKALAVLSKSGTAGGTAAQWSLVLSAEYFSSDGSSLSSYAIGTVTDVGTWTSISGTTTAGGSAISSSAEYVDLTFTMTALGTVTGTAKPTIKSLLLTTSTPGGGGAQSFLVAETFTSSTTWNVPAGVDYLVAVVGAGGGGGGGGGHLQARSASSGNVEIDASGGGGAGRWYKLSDLDVSDQSSISVGIGAGGAGGTVVTFTKDAASSTTFAEVAGGVGGVGGATTFGSYFSLPGGGGGNPGSTGGGKGTGGTAGGNPTTIVYGGVSVGGGAGGNGGDSGDSTVGGVGGFNNFTIIPYSTPIGSCADGSASTGTGGVRTAGTAGVSTTQGWIGGGGGAGGVFAGASNVGNPYLSRGGRNGGGGGGESLFIKIDATATVSGTAGAGGPGAAGCGAGGGAGGSILISSIGGAQQTAYNASSITSSSGVGAEGGGGFLTLVYIA